MKKHLLEQIIHHNIHLEMKSHPPTKEEKVIPLGKAERFPHVKSQNTYGLSKRKNRF